MLGKLVKGVLGLLMVVVVGVLVVSLFLPGEWNVEKSVTIEARPEAIFPLVNDVKRWPEWLPAKEKDPDVKYNVPGKSEGEAAVLTWEGDRKKTGKGSLTIKESNPETGIKYEFSLMAGRYHPTGEIRFEAATADSTKVTWTDTGKLDLIGKFTRSRMEDVLGQDMERGLAKLKARVERPPTPEEG